MGLFFVFNTATQVVSLGHPHGIVRGDIPVVEIPIGDDLAETSVPARTINRNTLAVVMNSKGDFFFGPIAAFSSGYQDVRNKFLVKTQERAAQYGNLKESIDKWLVDRFKNQNIKADGIAVLVPSSAQPMSTVISVMAELRKSPHFDRVILANGLF